MSRVLHGMPLESLPNPGELQPGDQIVAYREDTGKAYRSNIAGLGAAANQNISDAFSTAVSYSVGDYCIYDDTLYKFTTDHHGDWDDGDVVATNVGTELKDNLDSLTDVVTDLTQELSDIVITQTAQASKTITITANTEQQLSSYVSIPSTPSGYTRLFYQYYGNGSASVVSPQFNSTWVKNTASSEKTITPSVIAVFVKSL